MSTKKILKSTTLIFVSLFIMSGCKDGDIQKNLDSYIKRYSNEKEFSLILEDMNEEGTFFTTYKHKYRIILHRGDGTPYEKNTSWVNVSKDFYLKNQNNLGMTILEKNGQGKISKVASPPGYRYVGDTRYGEWKTHNGRSFWAFYGQYMFMNQMFRMIQRPVYREDYKPYSSGGYYGQRSYYGPKKGNSTLYGTNSSGTRKSHPNFFRRRASKSSWSSSRSRTGARSRGSGLGK